MKYKKRKVDFELFGEEIFYQRGCDIPGCPANGEHKAPKSRVNTDEHFWFCLNHVQEYNKNWNYFEGMSEVDIEKQMYKDMTWDRPTWQAGASPLHEENLRSRTYEGFRYDGAENFDDAKRNYLNNRMPEPELEALSVMGLEPPIIWEVVRKRYKELAKKYHPDQNRDNKEAEEIFKKINHSYSLLKVAYERYSILEKK